MTTWEIAAQGNANLFRTTRKFAGYKGYGNTSQDFFENEFEAGVNMKKYILNQLPTSVRRAIKKIGKQ